MSNLAWLRGFRPVDVTIPADLRPAFPHEIDAAIRLLVCSPSGLVDENQLRDFARLAVAHRQDSGGVWVAAQGERLLSVALPVISPGRTMLLFLPNHLFSDYQRELTKQLVGQVCRRSAEAGIHLAQCLLDVHDIELPPILQANAFERLAELHYLQATCRNVHEPLLPPTYHWLTYSPETHALFASTILETYQDSLDCPKLNGIRTIEDILAGHRATGEFDPSSWYLLLDGKRPLGALLLAHLNSPNLVELVYLGLVPASRGRGIGDILMRRAGCFAATKKGGKLSLAVDAGNMPALKLYWRHGLQVVGRKLAFLRDVRICT